MTWEPRPVPDVTPETRRFWRAAAEGRLLLNDCPDCGLTYFHPRALCPDCFAEAEWIESDGTGEIYTYSVVHQISGWPEEHVPVIVAYVELDEGPRLLTNVVGAEPADVGIGDRVRVTFVETENPDVAVPVFEPVSSA
ncbi:Zn-ribbon domain-containing OB-fold protein [Natrarchaeobius oligotrophus]|uniref:Zn-ribbon domain-containing OB-fold protein n=1 Tax=Natrarchaeobius chitinivorans TaxID=1679083 RepID=A0A3N6PSP9_NATCH|nr:Zn-ribbon domain-containing OB-fold protein [Natrarchaeobius chitinivorans]RQH02586.1 Zn-ribbon domain-containing OB-fold protein [Natrarchaeobius chitinivorans]